MVRQFESDRELKPNSIVMSNDTNIVQEQINYKNIMNLGFVEEEIYDSVYYNQYGFEYAIITKYLTKKIYLDWDKVSRVCTMVRIDKEKNILAKMPIRDLDHLHEILNFFDDDARVEGGYAHA